MAWGYSVRLERNEPITDVKARRKKVEAAGFKPERYGFPSEYAAREAAEAAATASGVAIEVFDYSPGII